MTQYQKEGRHFIAKMDSFGIDRYWSFETDEHVDMLVQGVINGGGLMWRGFIMIRKIANKKFSYSCIVLGSDV